MRGSFRPLLRILIPFAAAYLVISSEGLLAELVRIRPGVLPVAMVSLLGALLFAPVRRWLIVTLCFGISLLALRDSLRFVPLPAEIDYVFVERAYPLVWGFLAILGTAAGIGEALAPGAIWARRCYFGAAAIYFCGHGLFGLLRTGNWESLALLLMGFGACAGMIFAHKIVAAEVYAEPMDEDLIEQAERMKQRAESMAAREWRDVSEERPKVAQL